MTAEVRHRPGRTEPDQPRAFGLDVLRVAAALGVLVTHVAFVTGVVSPLRIDSRIRDVLPRLDVGVWIFFVLSGLFICRPYIRSILHGGPRVPTRTYAARRLSRIYPLYWFVLGFSLLTAPTPLPPPGRLVADVLLLNAYVPAWTIGPITQAWSLSTELAFYAFVPLWFAGCRRLFVARRVDDARRRVRWLAAGLVGWAVVALVWRLAVIAGTSTFDYTVAGAVDTRGALLSWLPNHLDTFAVGAAFALWIESGAARRVGTPLRALSYAIAAGALWVASTSLGLPPVFTGFDGPQTLGRHWLFLLCSAALVLPSAAALATRPADRDAVTDRRRAHAPVRPAVIRVASAAALASYGIYLWHQWVIEHLTSWRHLREFATPFPTMLAAVVVGSTAAAAVTYWLVERPASTVVLGRRRDGPPVVRPLGRHPELDGLRGLAILAVLATHLIFLNAGDDAWSLRGGFLGVDVFLALSAFLIGSVLLNEVDRTGTVDGTRFARRRIRRLYPPLVVFLVLQAVISAVVLGVTYREELLQAVLALTFTANWQLSLGHQPPYTLVHLWSLSLEGQFYLLMAVGLWLGRRRIGRPERVVAALVLAAACVALWRLALYRWGVALPALYERTGARADSMLLGVAAAVAWRSGIVSDRRLRTLGMGGVAFLAVAMVAASPGSPWLFQGGFTVVAAAAAVAVAAAATGRGVVARIGSASPLRWVGSISYSLYLWHLPVYVWVAHVMSDAPLGPKVVVAVSGSVLAGWLSFRVVESRVLPTWRRSTSAAGPVVAAGAQHGSGGREDVGQGASGRSDGGVIAGDQDASVGTAGERDRDRRGC